MHNRAFIPKALNTEDCLEIAAGISDPNTQDRHKRSARIPNCTKTMLISTRIAKQVKPEVLLLQTNNMYLQKNYYLNITPRPT